ncbi:MAG: hypothetical protein LBL13_04140 [Bacteroidales bacterium]|jgi:hypothetical protein|nr:hypothetical protein [Bacteroidales bacterium]
MKGRKGEGMKGRKGTGIYKGEWHSSMRGIILPVETRCFVSHVGGC